MVMIKYVTVYRSLLSYQKRHGGMESTILANIARMDSFFRSWMSSPPKPGCPSTHCAVPTSRRHGELATILALGIDAEKSRDQRDWRIVLGTGKNRECKACGASIEFTGQLKTDVHTGREQHTSRNWSHVDCLYLLSTFHFSLRYTPCYNYAMNLRLLV
jgi:hypothetical protein